MKMSCNGCRILRKACCSDCPIRPCLLWIRSPESQSNATLFLAKFYGRAGLVNLIEAGPPHLRPALFRSLLYEACGRIVSPVHGSVGLLWTGNWVHCQAAVDAVLRGSPIVPLPSPPGGPAPHLISPLQTCDIRHVGKIPSWADLNRIQNRDRFNWSNLQNGATNNIHGLGNPGKLCFEPIPNHYQWPGQVGNRDSNMEDDSMFSVETVEGSLVNRAEPGRVLQYKGLSDDQDGDREVGLDLTLSLAPI